MSTTGSEKTNSLTNDVNSYEIKDNSTMIDFSSCDFDANMEINDSYSVNTTTTESEQTITNNACADSNDIIGFDQLESIISDSIGHLTELTPMVVDHELPSDSNNVLTSSNIISNEFIETQSGCNSNEGPKSAPSVISTIRIDDEDQIANRNYSSFQYVLKETANNPAIKRVTTAPANNMNSAQQNTFRPREIRAFSRVQNAPCVLPKIVERPTGTRTILDKKETPTIISPNTGQNNSDDMELLKQLTSNLSSNCGPFVLLPLSMLKYYLKPDALSGLSGGNKSENSTPPATQIADVDNESMFSEQTTDSSEYEIDTSLNVEAPSAGFQQHSPNTTQEQDSGDTPKPKNEYSLNRRRLGRKTRNKRQNIRSGSSSLHQRMDYSNLYRTHEDASNVSAFCKVCGDKASLHVHYGGRSCASCRAFFRRSVEAKTRRSGFEYSCKCVEGCIQKQEAICLISKVTRNFCKYCRYLRCQNSAGMSKAWVVSAHMPKVEKNPKSLKQEAKKETRKEEEERKAIKPLNTESFSTPEQLLEHMEQIRDEKKNGWCLPDTKLINSLKKMIIGEETTHSLSTKESLELVVNQEISTLAMQLPDFSNLRSKTRVRLLQSNTFTLHKLGLIKLIYDHIFNKNYGYEKILTSLFNISRTQYWKEKSYSNPELNENQRKVVIKKIVDLIGMDRKVFLFLFPILLFNNNGAKDATGGVPTSYQQHYTRIFEDYLLMNRKENTKQFRSKSDIAINMKHYLQQF